MNNNKDMGAASVIGIPIKKSVALRAEATKQSTNRLMTIPRTETNTSYHYFCPLCGNEFTLNYYCHPDHCHSCQMYVSFMIEKEVTEITIAEQYCPICNQYFNTSEYLNSNFKNDHKARWLANMVTHHRHEHITSWDNSWSRNGYARNYLNVDYTKEKHKVNERAKRQILRKCKEYMIENGFCAEDILKLKGTEKETIELYKKHLPTNNQNNTNLNLKI